MLIAHPPRRVKWAATLPSESIVQVQGTISKVSKPIESSTVTNKDAEIKVSKIFLVSKVAPSAPQVSGRAVSYPRNAR